MTNSEFLEKELAYGQCTKYDAVSGLGMELELGWSWGWSSGVGVA